MQKPQERRKSLSVPEQLPSFTPVESSEGDVALKRSQGVFASFEKASLKTHQLVMASAAGVISFLTVLALIQLSVRTVPQSGSTALSHLTEMDLVVLLGGVAVGVATFALGQISTNQINRGLDDLQTQFNSVACGDLEVQSKVDLPSELKQLAMSFEQIIRMLDTRISEAQRKAKEQETAKEGLQHQLIELICALEETSDSSLFTPEETTSNDKQQVATPPGTLLDFLDNFHSLSQVTTDPELLLGSSSPEEIQQRKEDLQYREVWLQATLHETQRELKFLALIIHGVDKYKVRVTNEG